MEGEAEVILERHVSLSKIRHVLEDTYQLKHHEVKKYASDPNEYSRINEISGEDRSRSDISAIDEQKQQEKSSHVHEADKLVIKTLGKGEYFGEVAAMTGHKHTATVRVKKSNSEFQSTEQSLIVAAMPNKVFKRLEEEVPASFLTFKQHMKKYNDRDSI